MKYESKRKVIIKSLLTITLLIICAALLCAFAPSCKEGNSNGMSVGFVSADYCPNGEIDDSKIVSEMNAQTDERVYMVVDFKIKAPRNNDGNESVTLECKITPASVADASVQETNTGETTEITVDDVTTINAVYKIPDKASETRNIRFVVRIDSKGSDIAEITLKLDCPANLKAVKASTVKKQAVIGYTDDLTFNGSEVTGITDKSVKKVIIPSMYNGKKIISIGEGAFANCKEMTSIFIPYGVTLFDNKSFSGCSSLTEIDIPVSVKVIGYESFKDCSSLTKITLPNGVTCISESMFSGCVNLTEVNIPDKVEEILYNAFYGCSALKEVTLPDSVKSVGESAFSKCASLTKINIPEGVKEIERDAFTDCNKLETIEYDAVNCKYIGHEVKENFWNVKYTVWYELFNCISLKELKIGTNVKTIPEAAFYNCTSLEGLIIPNSVEKIGERAFYDFKGSNLKKISIGKGVRNIDDILSDKNCPLLESIEVDKNNKNYKSKDNCLLTKDGKTLILGCNNSIIPNGVVSIEENAFSGCNELSNITIPDTVTVIGKSAFSGCRRLTSVVIPDGVTQIGDSAFSNCDKLMRMDIPISVTVIGSEVFNDCSILCEVYYKGRAAQWKSMTKNISIYNESTGNFRVICNNGTLDKDGNEVTE